MMKRMSVTVSLHVPSSKWMSLLPLLLDCGIKKCNGNERKTTATTTIKKVISSQRIRKSTWGKKSVRIFMYEMIWWPKRRKKRRRKEFHAGKKGNSFYQLLLTHFFDVYSTSDNEYVNKAWFCDNILHWIRQ